MIRKIHRVNPVAKAMTESRRRTQVVPDKTKYNRKRDKDASEQQQIPYPKDKQTSDD